MRAPIELLCSLVEAMTVLHRVKLTTHDTLPAPDAQGEQDIRKRKQHDDRDRDSDVEVAFDQDRANRDRDQCADASCELQQLECYQPAEIAA